MFGKRLFKRRTPQVVTEETDRSPEELANLRQRLRGKPLRPRAIWLLGPAAYVLACAIALIVVLTYTDGVWLAIGLTVVAFFAGHIP
jgi:hypothetical protein